MFHVTRQCGRPAVVNGIPMSGSNTKQSTLCLTSSALSRPGSFLFPRSTCVLRRSTPFTALAPAIPPRTWVHSFPSDLFLPFLLTHKARAQTMSVRGWLKLSHGLGTVGPAAATLVVTNTPVLRCPHVDTAYTDAMPTYRASPGQGNFVLATRTMHSITAHGS